MCRLAVRMGRLVGCGEQAAAGAGTEPGL